MKNLNGACLSKRTTKKKHDEKKQIMIKQKTPTLFPLLHEIF
jgi:hypothetical protein